MRRSLSGRRFAAFACLALLAVSCKSMSTRNELRGAGVLDATTDEAHTALEALGVTFDQVGHVQVDVENTVSFWRKIDAVKGATRTIDLAYFLYGVDYAGSYLGKLLIEKATGENPVKVRLMVDAKTSGDHRHFFKMLVAKGQGNIEVHYFRPVPQVIIDDFERLGLDAKKFIGALLSQNMPELTAQIKNSNVMRRSPELQASVQQLAEVLTRRKAAEVAAMEADATEAEGSAGIDALVALKVLRVVQAMHRSIQSLGLQATGRDWFDLTKWTHHKLLLVDGQDLLAGGRNLEDAYHWEKDHAIRVGDNIKKYVFMDVDFHVNSAAIAARAKTTFDAYLDSDCYQEPPLPDSCETQIPMKLETAGSQGEIQEAYDQMLAKAERLEAQRNYERTYEPVHKGTFIADNVSVAYAENRMFPARPASDGKLFTEEASQHNAALVALIDATPQGQDIIIQNAYVYFPSGLQMAIVRALTRGVNVTVISNSPESSDLGFVAQAARLQYRHFLELNEQLPGKFTVYEYLTEESLHAKVTIIGDRYLVIGSINADPRCEYLDSNNGIIIDNGTLTTEYKQWLLALKDKLMNERTRTVVVPGGTNRTTPLMRQVDLARIDAEDAQETTDQVRLFHRRLKPLAAASFLDNAVGTKARNVLQALFIQY